MSRRFVLSATVKALGVFVAIMLMLIAVGKACQAAEPLRPFWTGPVYGVFTDAGPDSMQGPRAKIHVPIGVALTSPVHIKGVNVTPEAQFQWTTKAYLGEDSDPLRDAAYNWFPYVRIAPDSVAGAFQWLKAGPEHLSNGMDGSDSRSMNAVSAEAMFAWNAYGVKLDVYAKVWGIYDYGDQPGTLRDVMNLYKSVGGQLRVVGSLDMVDLAVELGPNWQDYMAYVPLHEFYAFGVYLQLHNGEAEGLLDYASSVTSFYGGLALRPKL